MGKVPPKRFGYVRQTGLVVKHAAPSTDDPHCVTLTFVGKGGAPVPPWMLPLNVVRDIFLSILPKTLKIQKEKIIDNWEFHGHSERIAKNPDLYGAIGAIQPERQ